jgi:hypothetical protein
MRREDTMKLLIAIVLGTAAVVTAGSTELLDDTLDISVGQYRYVSFRVQPAQADSTVIRGSITTRPDTAALEVLLFHVDDFIRWRSHGTDTDTLFYSSAVSGNLSIPVDGSGDYYLVLSNRGNMTPVSVAASITLVFEGSGVEYDSLKMALDLALLLMAVSAIVVLVVRTTGMVRKKRKTSSG